MLDAAPRQDTLAFQIDLWSARGELPRDMIEVDTRLEGHPLFQPHARWAPTSSARPRRCAAPRRSCWQRCARSCGTRPEAALLAAEADEKVYNIIQMIYRARIYEGASKDYEFSRRTMEEHWKSGYSDMTRTLRHPEVLQRPTSPDGVFTFDLKHQPGE